MYVSELRLVDFRNYPRLEQSLAGGLTLLVGDNAQGKTNLLEAICVAAVGSSPRTSTDAQLIRWDQPAAAVKLRVERRTRDPLSVEAQLRRGAGRAVRINGVPRRTADLVGQVGVVVFMTADLEIVKGEPAARRKFLDRELGALSRSYQWHLSRYRRVLEQRNEALRQLRTSRRSAAALESWDEQLARYGGHLVDKRRRFVDVLNGLAAAHYAAQAGPDHRLAIRYLPGLDAARPVPDDAHQATAAIAEALAAGREEEIRRGITLAGPHRDDLGLEGDGVDLRMYGSQGEQRSTAIALKLGLRDLLERTLGEPPILLLDDVLSELDEQRRRGLLEATAGSDQAVLTGTDLSVVDPARRAEATILRVAAGQVWEDAAVRAGGEVTGNAHQPAR
jgi:DNA replication and repair protein RecF